jgi:hypothetical protein
MKREKQKEKCPIEYPLMLFDPYFSYQVSQTNFRIFTSDSLLNDPTEVKLANIHL